MICCTFSLHLCLSLSLSLSQSPPLPLYLSSSFKRLSSGLAPRSNCPLPFICQAFDLVPTWAICYALPLTARLGVRGGHNFGTPPHTTTPPHTCRCACLFFPPPPPTPLPPPPPPHSPHPPHLPTAISPSFHPSLLPPPPRVHATSCIYYFYSLATPPSV